jgi:23S rRNA (guanine745-N1)-methyltransferase
MLAANPRRDSALIADAGCGEAYYLQQLAASVATNAPPAPSIMGFDISKWAIQAAARRMPATWIVASNRQVPVADSCVDILLCMFGFPDYAEFQRILKPGGALLLASAGPQHLIELREIIYPEVRHKEPARVTAAETSGYSLLERSQLSYQLELAEQSAIDQLLCMTPHMFRASSEGKRKASMLGEIALTVDVVFEVLSDGGVRDSRE